MGGLKFAASGLSHAEKRLIGKRFEGTEFVLDEAMSSETSYLLMFRNMFTEKRVLADRWGVPVVSVLWVHQSLQRKNIKNYHLKKYEGSFFSTSGITNQIFINYYKLSGAHYSAELNRCTDFLVVKSMQTESAKIKYARENAIPIVLAEEAFQDRVMVLKKQMEYGTTAKSGEKDEIFNGLVFYFKGDSDIHREVRKTIIEHGGNRVEERGGDVAYTVHFGGSRKSKTAVWYQWILDSAELGVLLSPCGYLVEEAETPAPPLAKATVYLSVSKEETVKCKNKVKALGGEVAVQMGSKVTHCVVESEKEARKLKKEDVEQRYRVWICSPEWLNQCIYHAKKIREANFGYGAEAKKLPEITVRKKEGAGKPLLRCVAGALERWVVQFTGVVDELKKEAVRILEGKGARVLDMQEYSSACTHLVVGTVSLSIKLLSAAAAGANIMDYRAVEDIGRGAFTEERDYSLRNKEMKIDVGRYEQMMKSIIRAAEKWRKRRKETGEKAFSRWKIVVLVESKRAGIEQLVENGGGTALSLSQTKTNKDSRENLCVFVDKNTKVPEHLSSCRRVQMVDMVKHLARLDIKKELAGSCSDGSSDADGDGDEGSNGDRPQD